jgi:hypothetical protein
VIVQLQSSLTPDLDGWKNKWEAVQLPLPTDISVTEWTKTTEGDAYTTETFTPTANQFLFDGTIVGPITGNFDIRADTDYFDVEADTFVEVNLGSFVFGSGTFSYQVSVTIYKDDVTYIEKLDLDTDKFLAKLIPGRYFISFVLDVTGVILIG